MDYKYPTKEIVKEMKWKKGDVLEGTDRRRKAARHYIIALEPYRPGDFIGVMLTSSNEYPENIPMKSEYIRTHADDETEFKFQFKNTHFVKGRFIKLESWGPFTKVGELTREGMDLVDEETKDLAPIPWDDYVARMQRS